MSIDGENFFWIAVNNGRFIRNPTKEDLGGTKIIYYNKTNICSRCREENRITDKSILYPNSALRERDTEGNCAERWLCNNCHGKHERKNPNSSNAKGDLFQELTCRWRSTVSTITVEDLNKKLDCYNTPIDHSRDSELGIPQTKGCFYNSYSQHWHQNFKNEHNQIANGFEFDVLILYCASEDGKTIDIINSEKSYRQLG